jgi:hypothetical protein
MSGVSYQPYGDAGLPYASGAITTGAGLSNPSGDSGSGSTDMSDSSATGTGTGSEEESKVAPAVAAVGALALIGATIKYGWATDIMAKLRK